MVIYQEKDLRMLKYHILISPRHDRAVRDLALMLGMEVQPLRRFLIERLDMQYLENLAGRYEQWVERGDRDNPLDRALGRELLTQYLPLVDAAVMDRIRTEARVSVDAGGAPDAISARARARLVEVLRP